MLNRQLTCGKGHLMDIPLSSHLCFKLYVSSRLIVQLFSETLGSYGLTYPKYLVLVALNEQDGQTVSELGKRLHLDSGTLSPLLKSLVQAGFISRKRSLSDDRVVTSHITKLGSTARARGAEAAYKVFCGTGVSAESLESLRVAMDDFIQRCENAQVAQQTESHSSAKSKLRHKEESHA